MAVAQNAAVGSQLEFPDSINGLETSQERHMGFFRAPGKAAGAAPAALGLFLPHLSGVPRCAHTG